MTNTPTVAEGLRPLHNNILVRMDPPKDEHHGIIIPDRAKQDAGTGTVVRCGPGWIDPETGRRHEMDVKVGDRIAFEIFRAVEKVADDVLDDQGFVLESVLYTVIQERHVLAVLEDEDGEIEVNA